MKHNPVFVVSICYYNYYNLLSNSSDLKPLTMNSLPGIIFTSPYLITAKFLLDSGDLLNHTTKHISESQLRIKNYREYLKMAISLIFKQGRDLPSSSSCGSIYLLPSIVQCNMSKLCSRFSEGVLLCPGHKCTHILFSQKFP